MFEYLVFKLKKKLSQTHIFFLRDLISKTFIANECYSYVVLYTINTRACTRRGVEGTVIFGEKKRGGGIKRSVEGIRENE